MIFCLHVEFFFMLMSFTWLTDDLLKDNPPSKFGWSIFPAQICVFCGKYEKPINLATVQAWADKSHLCSQIDNKTNCSPGSSRFSIWGRTVIWLSPCFGTLFMPWFSGYPRYHSRIPRLLVLWVSSDIPKLFLFAPCTEQLSAPHISNLSRVYRRHSKICVLMRLFLTQFYAESAEFCSSLCVCYRISLVWVKNSYNSRLRPLKVCCLK